jgi:steroid delta-isomerase-like uncharacterized protein
MLSAERETAREQLIDEFCRRWSAHDVDSLMQLFTDDIVYEDVALGRVNRGKAELTTFAKEFLSSFPDVTFEATSKSASESRGAAEWTMRGTNLGDSPEMPATGKSVEVRGVSVLMFEGDRIRRCTDYWDAAGFLRQLGVMPGAG